jgi:hypothetical protein
VWYLLSAWDSQEWLPRWAEAEEPGAEGAVVEAARVVVGAEQRVVEARGSAAREFPGTRLRHL